MPPLLTVGFATRDDPLAWMTINALRIYHADLLDHIELVIVDNSPEGSPHARDLEQHVRGVAGIRYVRALGEPSSCTWKNRVFQEARGEYVLQCDSHVLFEPGAIAALLGYFAAHPDSQDLIMGPCLSRAGHVIGTQQMLFAAEAAAGGPDVPADAVVHSGVVCRGNQLGVWVNDARGLDAAAPAYEIMQQGTGAFACRRAAWPGFHPAFAGFGGNEPYLMESFRDRGSKVLCLPALRWVHCFLRPDGPPYPLTWHDRIRNYLVGFSDLAARGGPRAPAARQLYQATLAHFGRLVPRSVRRALEDATRVATQSRETHCMPPDLYWRSLQRLSVNPGGAIPKGLFSQLAQLLRERQQPGRALRTLECGAGISTLLFDAMGTEHICLEHSPSWVERVSALIEHPTTRVIHAPLTVRDHGPPWYAWSPPQGLLCDLILIDGPPGYDARQPGRLGALGTIERLLAPGGIILIDDAQRPMERVLATALAEATGLDMTLNADGARKWYLLRDRHTMNDTRRISD